MGPPEQDIEQGPSFPSFAGYTTTPRFQFVSWIQPSGLVLHSPDWFLTDLLDSTAKTFVRANAIKSQWFRATCLPGQNMEKSVFYS